MNHPDPNMAATRSIFASKGEVRVTAYIADPSSSDLQMRSGPDLGNASETAKYLKTYSFLSM